ncbi:hypothetical protein VTK56DRAFT_8933 [Thermocarpiscus australiensis]
MAPLQSLVAVALLFLSAANAHFELLRPAAPESNEDQQVNAPCGGTVPDLSQKVANDFHVAGDSVQVLLGHPQASWLIRATLDPKAAGNWTQLFPIVQQSGRGNFCEPAVAAPSEWAGKKGIIGVACDGPDGLLYQCAAVNFVSGANTAPDSSTCNNGSAVSVSFKDDPTLTSLLGGSSSSSTSPSASGSGNPSHGNSAASIRDSGLPLAVTALMLLLGAALL